MWRKHMPYSQVLRQQLATLASQAASSSVGVGRAGVGHGPMGARSNSANGLLPRPLVKRQTSHPQLSALAQSAGSCIGARGASSPDLQEPVPLLKPQLRSALEDAKMVGVERMNQFLLWHLPGTSQGSWASPFTNPLLFMPVREERMVHLHASRLLRFSASQPKIEFFNVCNPAKQACFDLDWSSMIPDLDASDASVPRLCDVKFHPFLPLAITCFPSLSSFVVNYRGA
jgi:hypothetical protein